MKIIEVSNCKPFLKCRLGCNTLFYCTKLLILCILDLFISAFISAKPITLQELPVNKIVYENSSTAINYSSPDVLSSNFNGVEGTEEYNTTSMDNIQSSPTITVNDFIKSYELIKSSNSGYLGRVYVATSKVIDWNIIMHSNSHFQIDFIFNTTEPITEYKNNMVSNYFYRRSLIPRLFIYFTSASYNNKFYDFFNIIAFKTSFDG